MSVSIFNSALGRSLRRCPLSRELSGCLRRSVLRPTAAPITTTTSTTTTTAVSPSCSAQRHCRSKRTPRSRDGNRNYSDTAATIIGDDNPIATETKLVTDDGPEECVKDLPGVKIKYTKMPRLLPLLHEIGCCRDILETHPGKTDLSYNNPFKLTSTNQPELGKGKRRIMRLSLREITTLCIYRLYKEGQLHTAFSTGSETADLAGFNDTISKVFTPEIIAYLESRGCTSEDVIIWGWILTAKDVRTSMSRLQEARNLKTFLPPFLISFMLRRSPIKSELVNLFPIVESLFSPENRLRIQDAKTTVMLLIRLLRCVRAVWPAKMPGVVDLFIAHLDNPTGAEETLPAWVTHTYNRFISLLSIPTHEAPYMFITTMQKCQFALVEKLASMKGNITREGYRGLIKVQLAHAKLPHEKENVRNMQTNWPPWQVDKDGWVATHRDPQAEAVSRAGHILQQMQEAGFRPTKWEKGALVLAGKDTDGTPTIQTRQIISKRLSLWAARVTATRTIEEAWWVFLEYKKSLNGATPSRSVYHAMFEKIVADKKVKIKLQEQRHTQWVVERWSPERRKVWLDWLAAQQKRNVPGDGMETIAAPLNPKDGIYNPEPPPNMEEFFEMMQRDGLGLRPLKRLARLLIKEAPNLEFAAMVLMQWNSEEGEELLAQASSYDVFEDDGALEHPIVDWPILTAFLTFMCKNNSVERALSLLRHYQPPYIPAWNTVAAELAWAPALQFMSVEERTWRLRTVWELFEEMTAIVGFDDETLRILASTVEKWMTLEVDEEGLAEEKPPIDQLIQTFWKDWAITIPEDITPTNLVWPKATTVHALIRALGVAARFKEIEELLVFLDRIEFNLNGHSGERVLVAARVFLEGATHDGDYHEDEERNAVLERLNVIVEARWGGWGSPDPDIADVMAQDYMTMGGLKMETASVTSEIPV
ncbi:hypothetical protein EDC01DRAFT_626200 [Geopyxis carbonaria]|nr:hypothetical protein EDC01DRAFT_626200 [Geopyxis carbonaria]